MALPMLCIAGGISLTGYGVSCLVKNDNQDELSHQKKSPESLLETDMMKAALTPVQLGTKKKSGERFGLVVYAPWCSACKYFKGTFRNAVKAGVPLVAIDGNSYPDAVADIEAFPTIIVYDERGNEVKRHVGGMDVGPLKKFVSL